MSTEAYKFVAAENLSLGDLVTHKNYLSMSISKTSGTAWHYLWLVIKVDYDEYGQYVEMMHLTNHKIVLNPTDLLLVMTPSPPPG